jgi:ABC-type nitrate/sulfonate/bicarbonate transport system permease component
MVATAIRYSPLLILALVWEALVRTGLISKLVLPPFTAVMAAFETLARDPDTYTHILSSVTRAGSGLALAIVLGTTAGVLMAWYPTVRAVVNPLVQMFYPMPKSALIPVMILWFGLGDMSKVVLIFLGCLLPIVVSSFNGARGVDDVLIWSARSLGASDRKVLWQIVVPAALPEILTGIRTALAISFVLLVSSELVIARDGIGYLISGFGDGGVYDAMFACIIIVVAMGFTADRLFQLFMRRMLIWRE